ncbi:MAG: tetratricopeptide repeat protein [Duncaniella sp.]|nr:tetratricopeptide repeat protein [Duncaniella sp.]
MNEELKKQIADWHAADRHKEIINALERIPAAERDYDTIGFLARAYNNINEYAKAADLLESVREEGEDDAVWNFRMGYSQYYLDNNAEALRCFNKAHALDPDDEDALYFIRQCNIYMPLAGRVERFWKWFVENERKLSDMIHAKTQEDADDFMAFVREGSALISENMNYNLGGDHEFTFSVEGWPDLFILYPYIISCMPESLKAKWKFNSFNHGTDQAFGFRMYGADIDTARIMVRASYDERIGKFHVSYYEKSLNALSENESGGAMWVILENTLGEGVSFKYIDSIEQVTESEDAMIPLTELRKHIKATLEAHGQKFFENPKEIYSSYRMNPQESDDLRYDVITGSTCLDSVVADYYSDATDIFDHINSFGAQAVFIAFQNPDNTADNDILNLRYDIEDRISDMILEPMNLGQVLGGATGTHRSYIDLIVYDFITFVHAVKPLLEQYPQFEFYLSDFRRNSGLIQLT